MGANKNLEERIISLQDQLLGNLNQKTYQGILNTIDELKSKMLTENFLSTGDKATDFTLPNAMNKNFTLSKLCQKNKKVILKFFRGGWCPYCYLELRAYQEILPQIKDCGATLIAISSERPDYCLNTMERNGLEFEVLSDKGKQVAEKYNLVFKSEATVLEELSFFKKAIQTGDISYDLPIPATFIIDENMVVRYAYANPDYRKRAEPKEVLEALKNI